jgi:glycosyltransferase involved in cell wall biosynthesis
MKIAFCHHLSLSYYGGGEKWLISLTNELVNRGHEVKIYALPLRLEGSKKIDPKEHLNPQIEYEETMHKRVDADVAYITYNPLNWLNFRTSSYKIGGIHSHAYWKSFDMKYGFLPNLANAVNKIIKDSELRKFDAIHVVNNVYEVKHPRVYYIPNFVDSHVYHPCAEKADKFSIAYLGRPVWQKGFDVYEEIIKRLKDDIEFKDCNFYISGGNIQEKDLPSFISKNHVIVLPSRVDTFGLSIIESLMCGTPVITTPLLTHACLEVPIHYAQTINDFIDRIRNMKYLWDEHRDTYQNICDSCRMLSLQYDKKEIVDRIENMFKEVCA